MTTAQHIDIRDKAAIVGIGETAYMRGADRPSAEAMLEATRVAIADSGLKPQDIDGIVLPPVLITAEEVAANLGIRDIRYSVGVNMGGASPVTSLQSAALAIAAGIAKNVVVMVGWNGFSALRPKAGVKHREVISIPALAVAKLIHPNIVQVFELGKINDSIFIAMEYLHGRELRQLMRERAELDARVRRFRRGRPPLPLAGGVLPAARRPEPGGHLVLRAGAAAGVRARRPARTDRGRS